MERTSHIDPIWGQQITELRNLITCLIDEQAEPEVVFHGTGEIDQILGGANLNVTMLAISMPMYSFTCSLGDEITISTTWNCPEVSIEQLSSDVEALCEQGDNQILSAVFDSALDWNLITQLESRHLLMNTPV